VLPGVTVTLKNADTGFIRSTATDDQGRYSFAALNPTGKWTISVELQGFAPQNREGLEFQANTKPEINFRLGVGTLQEAVTVQASAPLIRTRESELSTILDTKQVENLPTNGRNFLSLLQTSGSVVPTGATSSSNISVNGQGTRMANFIADGVSMTGREIRTMNGEFGGGNGLSIDVIKELQVITNGFKAETGQTGAGTISVVTKSGTNRLAGSAYGFWRPTDLVAANLLTGLKTTQKRQQYGGTIGGPLKKDRTHYFANYEDTNIDDVVVVTSVLAPGTFPAPQTQRQGFVKLNHRFDDHNAFDARYSFNRNTQEGQGVGGLNTYDRGTDSLTRDQDGVVSDTLVLSNTALNEFRFQASQRFNNSDPSAYSPIGTPAVARPSGNFGKAVNQPQSRTEKRFQIVENFSLTRPGHDLKFGTDFRSVYGTILEKWLKAPSEVVLGRKFTTLPLVG